MIEYLEGNLARKSTTEVVVDCGGVAYLVHVSLNTTSQLPASGSVKVLIHTHFSDNGQRLYGFSSESERSLFRILQGVRGVGPALALTLLSHEPADRLLGRLRDGDVNGLTRVKGIGRKTAERLLVELRDRLGALGPSFGGDQARENALVQGLMSLGLNEAEAATRARRVLRDATPEAELDELLRRALQSDSSSSPGRSRGAGS